ncbi:MAG: ABC transporter ATP-binding protein [Actinomycetota bacterium]|nr:ABC transporter ATP-binding protein [Actinomycetota bacterium]
MSIALEVVDVSKVFRLYHENANSLKERVMHMGRVAYDEFWALRDINMEVQEGSTVGILGHNGSGKSTLLKCMAGILQPTSGHIRVRGRVAALLELGAGFNPELSGRDNVFLNASLLGMSRREIERCFDDIVGFAELEKFIDQQVKYYSSGMYVRLGFAVAVNVDPDVLLIDEVLTVGDENFQRKCIERISLFQTEGRTIVVVSHGADLIRRLCQNAAVLDEGQLVAMGPSGEAIKALHEHLITRQRGIDASLLEPAVAAPPDAADIAHPRPEKTYEVTITGVSTDPPSSGGDDHISPGGALNLRIAYRTDRPVTDVNFWVNLHDVEGRLIFGYSSGLGGLAIDPLEGSGEICFRFASVPLLEGEFMWAVGITSVDGSTIYDLREQQDALSVLNTTQQIGLLAIPTQVSLVRTDPGHLRSSQAS